MPKVICKLTVCFENPFWVGIYERYAGGRLEVCRIVFGPEPKDYEVLELLLEHWRHLRFSPAIQAGGPAKEHRNPKRLQREIKAQLQATSIGTKAQQAIQLQRAEGKTAQKRRSKEERENEQRHKFELRQQQKKQKHRGH